MRDRMPVSASVRWISHRVSVCQGRIHVKLHSASREPIPRPRYAGTQKVHRDLWLPERDGVNFEVWPEAIELGRMFAEEGYELALVGGPVRDLLLHRKSHDLDFCTSARPEQFEHILRRFGRDGFWDMGRKFGTLGAMRRREDGTEVKVEVTTYRSDTYDPDSRKPEVNYGDTLEGDLSIVISR